MQDLKKYITLLRSKIGHLSPRPYVREGIQPRRDWFYILFGTAVVFCLSGFLAVYAYVYTSRGMFFSSDSSATSSQKRLNGASLDKIISEMNDRQKARADFLSRPDIPPDPAM